VRRVGVRVHAPQKRTRGTRPDIIGCKLQRVQSEDGGVGNFNSSLGMSVQDGCDRGCDQGWCRRDVLCVWAAVRWRLGVGWGLARGPTVLGGIVASVCWVGPWMMAYSSARYETSGLTCGIARVSSSESTAKGCPSQEGDLLL
jgi:hypothetical protein